ncbi:hypothetical protein BDY21DRAFT_286929, partial [Lineolata rhizophorae]
MGTLAPVGGLPSSGGDGDKPPRKSNKGTKHKPNYKRDRKGCKTCRRLRIKCDGALPICNNCHRRDRHCEGYDTR